MLTLEYRLYEDHEEISYMDIDLRLLIDGQVVFEAERLYLYTVLGFRKWMLNGFLQQQDFLLKADDHDSWVLFGLVHKDGFRWALLLPEMDSTFKLSKALLDHSDLERMFHRFLNRLDQDLRKLQFLP